VFCNSGISRKSCVTPIRYTFAYRSMQYIITIICNYVTHHKNKHRSYLLVIINGNYLFIVLVNAKREEFFNQLQSILVIAMIDSSPGELRFKSFQSLYNGYMD